MQKAEINVGEEYALSEERTPGTPFQRVRILGRNPFELRSVLFWMSPLSFQSRNNEGRPISKSPRRYRGPPCALIDQTPLLRRHGAT
jgi:hypothetical protein